MHKSRRTWRYLIAWLPVSLRDRIIRSLVKVPLFAFDPRLRVHVARSREDLEAAYKLLYRCYREDGLTSEQASGMRVNLFSLLPDTTTIVVKYESEVVGTVSVIRDSKYGLFTDSEYKSENDELRKIGRPIEVSALAVDYQFRSKGHAISFLLMKYLYWYTRFWMHGSHLVCTVHPRAQDFYRALFGFERQGPVVEYRGVQGALGIYLRMPLDSSHTHTLIRDHSVTNRSVTTFFLFQPDPRFEFPPHAYGQALDPAITPELLSYFGQEKTSLLQELPEEKRDQLLIDYWLIYGDLKQLNSLLPDEKKYKRRTSYRTNVHLSCTVLREDGQELSGTIVDLSARGCFVAFEKNVSLRENESLTIQFRRSNQVLSAVAQVRWQYSGSEASRFRRGYGFQFSTPQLAVQQLILQMHKAG